MSLARKKSWKILFLFPVQLVLFFYSQYAIAFDLNLVCTFKSFCEERLPGSCQSVPAKNLEQVQHVKVSGKIVEYWGDFYEIIKINDSIIQARHLEKYPRHESINNSLLNLNRYTGVMDLTHTLQSAPKETEKVNVLQVNRVQYICIKSAPKF